MLQIARILARKRHIHIAVFCTLCIFVFLFPSGFEKELNEEKNIDLEEELERLILESVGVSKRRLIDLGAAVRDNDPCFGLIDKGWSGLLVDGDEEQPPKWNERFPKNDKVEGVVSYILGDTIVHLLKEYGFDKNVDLLKIDIDSFDCFVMNKILSAGIRPRAIVMEINVKFPSHIRFALYPGYDEAGTQIPFDSEKRGHLYGCSLGFQLDDVMHPHGYEIYYMDWNNVLYIDKRKKKSFVKLRTDRKKWYDFGYWERPDRDKAFGFNKDIKHWNSMDKETLAHEIQSKLMPMSSYVSHHVKLNKDHYCFDSEGFLYKDSKNKTVCSKQTPK